MRAFFITNSVFSNILCVSALKLHCRKLSGIGQPVWISIYCGNQSYDWYGIKFSVDHMRTGCQWVAGVDETVQIRCYWSFCTEFTDEFPPQKVSWCVDLMVSWWLVWMSNWRNRRLYTHGTSHKYLLLYIYIYIYIYEFTYTQNTLHIWSAFCEYLVKNYRVMYEQFPPRFSWDLEPGPRFIQPSTDITESS